MKKEKILAKIKKWTNISSISYRHGNGYYLGRALLINPVELRKGLGVITPEGFGNVQSIDGKTSRVIVSFGKSYSQAFYNLDLKQYVVRHGILNKILEFSTHSYPFLYKDGQPVEYRITKKGKAMLSDYCQSEYEYVKIFSKIKYGRRVLASLESKGYKLKQDDTKKNYRTPGRYNFFGRFEIEYLRKKTRHRKSQSRSKLADTVQRLQTKRE